MSLSPSDRQFLRVVERLKIYLLVMAGAVGYKIGRQAPVYCDGRSWKDLTPAGAPPVFERVCRDGRRVYELD